MSDRREKRDYRGQPPLLETKPVLLSHLKVVVSHHPRLQEQSADATIYQQLEQLDQQQLMQLLADTMQLDKWLGSQINGEGWGQTLSFSFLSKDKRKKDRLYLSCKHCVTHRCVTKYLQIIIWQTSYMKLLLFSSGRIPDSGNVCLGSSKMGEDLFVKVAEIESELCAQVTGMTLSIQLHKS